MNGASVNVVGIQSVSPLDDGLDRLPMRLRAQCREVVETLQRYRAHIHLSLKERLERGSLLVIATLFSG